MGLAKKWLGVMAALFCVTSAVAQTDYPNKPITMVVGFPAGQATDIMSRLVADAMAKELGQSIVVENKPGQATSIALTHLKDKGADGYSMMLATPAGVVINPHLYDDMRYDTFKDFDFVGVVAEMPFVLATHTESPFKSLDDILNYAKENPGKINFSSPGNGSLAHMGMMLLQKQTGVQMTHVPYKGSPRAMQDLAAGRIDIGFDTPPLIMPLAEAGKLRILAATSADRIGVLPDVPTMIEAGAPNFTMTAWFMMVVPKGTDKAIINKLNATLKKILSDPAFVERLAKSNATVRYSTPEQAEALVREQYAMWDEVVKASAAKVD
ncbi:MAG: Bug family tripartite tricarboxylate transporter substrate binding protein [Burkholderiaceae bacterium]